MTGWRLVGRTGEDGPIPDNMVQNPGFEDPIETPWSISHWGANRMTIHRVSPGRAGNYAAKIVVPNLENGTTILTHRSLYVENGERYWVEAWFRTDGPEVGVTMSLQKASPHYTVYGQKILVANETWQRLAFEAVAQETTEARLVFRIDTADTPVYIDSVRVTPIRADEGVPMIQFDPTQPVPADYFGMHVNRGHIVGVWPNVAQTGAKTFRLMDTGTDWNYLERDGKGQFIWTRLDMYIQRIKAAVPDAKVMYCFARVPPWANGGNDVGFPQLDMQDFEDFVYTLFARNGHQFDYIEVWNEANHAYFWSGTRAQMIEMARIIKEAANIHAPQALLLSPNFTRTGLAAMDAYLADGGAQHSDALSIHIYSQSEQIEQTYAFMASVRQVLARHGLEDWPIYNTEGAVTMPVYAELPDTIVRGRIARQSLMGWLTGCQMACWYFWENRPGVNRVYLTDDFESFSSVGVGAEAMKMVTEWMVGTRFLSYHYDEVPAVHTAEVRLSDGREGQIVWTTSAFDRTVTLPRPLETVWRLNGTQTDTSVVPIINQEPVLLLYQED